LAFLNAVGTITSFQNSYNSNIIWYKIYKKVKKHLS